MISRMISSTCLVPFHGVLRLAYCNYILPPSPHTTGLDTCWIPHSLHTLRLGRQYIYTNTGVIRKETNDWNENDDEFSSSSSWRTTPPALQLFCDSPPKTSLAYTFTNTTQERLKRQYGTTDGLTDRFDIHYSDWATIMTYATLTPYESPFN